MPMVSATDVPLQPYPTGRTSPQAPSDYQQIPTSPQMFGSIEAEALQGAAKEGEKLATEVARIGAYQQHYLDRTEEDKLSSRLDDATHQRKYGDPTAGLDANGNPLVPGFKNRYGSDAIDYIKSGQPTKDFNDDVTRIAASASNDRVREMFLRQSRARRAAFDNSLDEHWTSQLAIHANQVQKATIGGLNRDIAAGYNNDADLNDTINKMTRAYLGQETDPVIRQELYNQAVTDGAGQAIQGALGGGNAQRASQIFEAYKGYMNGADQRKFNTEIQAHLNQQIGDQRYLNATRPGGDGETYWTPAGLAALRPTEGRYDQIHYPSGYTKEGVASTASGAYGFIDPTWQTFASKAGVDIAKYPRAYMAPPAVQDAVAAITPISHWTGIDERGRPFNSAAQGLAANPAYVVKAGVGVPAAPAPGAAAAPATSVEGNPIVAPAAATPGPVAAAPAETGPPAAPAAAPRLVFYGDSVANGTRSAMKAPGNTQDGRVPSEVLSNIGKDKLQGETAVISSGITNSRDAWRTDLPLVPEQIVAARDAGAGKVVLYGVGEGVKDNVAINAELQKIAAANNAQFVPLIGTGSYSDAKGSHAAGWHPRDYAGQGQYTIGQLGGSPAPTVGGAARPAAGAARPAPRPAVLPPGMREPGNI